MVTNSVPISQIKMTMRVFLCKSKLMCELLSTDAPFVIIFSSNGKQRANTVIVVKDSTQRTWKKCGVRLIEATVGSWWNIFETTRSKKTTDWPRLILIAHSLSKTTTYFNYSWVI